MTTGLDAALEALIEKARHHKMTPEERREHRVSMIMGLRGSKSTLTRSMVRDMLNENEGHAEAGTAT